MRPLLHHRGGRTFFLRLRKESGMTRRQTLYVSALIVAAVLMACAAALLAVSREAGATFPGKNGRIAYERERNLVIYTINPSRSGKTKVTNTSRSPSLGDYSPTGKKITYSSSKDYNDDEIFTINVGGEVSSKLPTTIRKIASLLTRPTARR
jgi:DMSO/TMAO reductase YedYZ molybdopterin-dependent catalytic subunit